MLFTKNKKQKLMEILSPVDGEIIPLKIVPDRIFAQNLMGKGIAIDPTCTTIYAPCEGEVSVISKDAHALGITLDNGCEILIHIGIDSVALAGEGFEVLTRINDYVYPGTPLLSFDLQLIKEKGICPYIIVILIENDMCTLEIQRENGYIQANCEPLFNIIKN